ncbi:MAG: hypothetical protein HKO95_18835 [Rhodobacteraceae bacterium]|nr:hypothetical protein [Alphaproteobacteria bacterium]MBT8475031.1 hypothetical protein [Alphaproteobacteria bacterium]NNF73403.1 hypothetical protein [Paracoccaceae bacterium]NNK68785.1 hypothetical protein [Paracoccaceae bacterium]
MSDHGDKLEITLLGPLALTAPGGDVLTPKGAKTQGLFALLACSPGYSRSRVWLQEKLWSDRGRPQAAASLRQALIEARKALGPLEAILQTTRTTVQLDTSRVWIDLEEPDAGDRAKSAEFFEGCRIRDPEFRAWMDVKRAELSGAAPARVTPAALGRSILIRRDRPVAGPDGLLASMFLDTVEKTLTEATSMQIVHAEAARSNPMLSLSAEAFLDSGQGGLRAALEEGEFQRSVWGGTVSFTFGGTDFADNPELLKLAHDVYENVTATLIRRNQAETASFDATLRAQMAIRKLFTFNPEEQAEADQLFLQAFERDPRGSYLAWRVMLRVIRQVEQHDGIDIGMPEEIDEFAARALELEPSNSMVLAAASNAAMLVRDDFLAARELAERSVRANPANPFSWDCLGISHLMEGRSESAHRLQLRARHIGQSSPFKHWWDMGCCLTATVTGRFEEARQYAEAAAALVPDFRPPLRYLTAIYANERRTDDAYRVMRRLNTAEPRFSLDRMVNDPDYPAAALKRSTLASKELLQILR